MQDHHSLTTMLPERSHFPEEVIHHILSYCSMKESARSSALSKAWNSAYSTRPVLNFEYSSSLGLKGFIEIVDRTLEEYHQDLRLHKVCFDLNSLPSFVLEWALPFHRWIEKATTDHCVQKIEIKYPHPLPLSMFKSKSLDDLSLFGCHLLRQHPLLGDYGMMMLEHLKTLKLVHVRIENDSTWDRILSGCLLLEDLVIEDCNEVLERFRLSLKLRNLKKVVIASSRGLRLDLQHCWANSLSLRGAFLHQWAFDNLGDKCPRLVSLRLENCHGVSKRLCFSSPTLRYLHMKGMNLKEYQFLDLPSLLRFTFTNEDFTTIPMVSVRRVSAQFESRLVVGKIQMSLLSFRELLQELAGSNNNKISVCLLDFVCLSPTAATTGWPGLIEIDELEFRENASSGFSIPYVLNGFLQICRPKAITIYCDVHQFGTEACKCLRKYLVGRRKLSCMLAICVSVPPSRVLLKLCNKLKDEKVDGSYTYQHSHQIKRIMFMVLDSRTSSGNFLEISSLDELDRFRNLKAIRFQLEWEETPGFD